MRLRIAFIILALVIIVLIDFLIAKATARDLGQWKYASPDVAHYFATLMQPDQAVSCCGAADVYWADKTDECRPSELDCALVAIITDTRPDAPLFRRHIPVGTRIIIPPSKIRHPPSENPTEHNLVFVSSYADPYMIYCWEPQAQF